MASAAANELLHVAAAADDVDEAARLLTEDHANVMHSDDSGRTALHIAAELGSLRMVELLLSYGAKETCMTDTLGAATPFVMACDRRHLECADVLADAGANVNAAAAGDLTTPLHRAAAAGDAIFVKFLISRGADTHRRCAAGRNASHHALSNGQRDVLMIYSMPPPQAPSAEEFVTHKQMQQAQYALLLGPKAPKEKGDKKGKAAKKK